MPKLYEHPRDIDLEFRNAYAELARGRGTAGADGAQGPRGPRGADGLSAIQTLAVVLNGTGVIGTILSHSILMDVWGVVLTQATGSNPVSFILSANGSPIITSSINVVFQPFRFWPEAIFYDTLLGTLLLEDTVYDLQTSMTGSILVVLQFLPVAGII